MQAQPTSEASPTVRAILAALAARGLGPASLADPASREGERARAALAAEVEERLPWFVRVVIGAGVFLGAILFAVFLVLTEAFESDVARIGGGVLLLAAAAWLRRRLRGDLAIELALAASVGGQALLIYEAAEPFQPRDVTPGLVMLVALQLVAIAAIPDSLHRFLSAAAGAIGAAALAFDLEIPCGVDGVIILAATYIFVAWLFDARLAASRFAHLERPVAYGLTLALLVLFAIQVVIGIAGGVGRHPFITSPAAVSFAMGGLLCAVVASALREAGLGAAAPIGLLAMGGAAGVAVLTHAAPGITAALLVLAVGHFRREQVLSALGLVFLGGFLFGFYYDLETTLLRKSLIVASTGAALLALRAATRFVARAPAAGSAPPPAAARPSMSRIGTLALATLVALGGPALLAADEERVLASGTPVLLRLLPRDPRSLIQGDYMALRYALAGDVGDPSALPRSGRLVITLDERGVASFRRLDDGKSPLAPGEHLLRYRIRGSRYGPKVRLAADSFLFEEGRAAAYEKARYGELRVSPSGEAVLVGLRDDLLNPLGRR